MKQYIYSLFLLMFFTASPLDLHAEEYSFEGVHYLGSFKKCSSQKLRDFATLKEAMIKAANASGATVLKESEFIFEPDGYTMVLLLSESHASIHTYPEYDACFVDLFTCGTSCSSLKFAESLKEYLEPQDIHEKVLYRD